MSLREAETHAPCHAGTRAFSFVPEKQPVARKDYESSRVPHAARWCSYDYE